MRLSQETIAALNADVERLGYDRAAQACGIVHFGIGAFHRAHQAVYTDDAMAAGDRDWGIIGVSLRSGDVADQMEPQDGLFTVSERGSGSPHTRLIGTVQRVSEGPSIAGHISLGPASGPLSMNALTMPLWQLPQRSCRQREVSEGRYHSWASVVRPRNSPHTEQACIASWYRM